MDSEDAKDMNDTTRKRGGRMNPNELAKEFAAHFEACLNQQRDVDTMIDIIEGIAEDVQHALIQQAPEEQQEALFEYFYEYR